MPNFGICQKVEKAEMVGKVEKVEKVEKLSFCTPRHIRNTHFILGRRELSPRTANAISSPNA